MTNYRFNVENASKIPSELKALPQWVVWRYETRNGKPTKIPFDLNGNEAKANDCQTWTTFGLALEFITHNKAYAGIGFEFNAPNALLGIDLDDCIGADGQLKQWGQTIIQALNSYSEISPSGTGVKIWIKGELPRWFIDEFKINTGKRKPYGDGEIEVYRTGRYFCVTGERLAGSPESVNPVTVEVLDAFLGQVWKPQDTDIFADGGKPIPAPVADDDSPDPVTRPAPVADDDELVQRACKTDEKFRLLWAGNTGEYAGDDSRADLALCEKLAYYTGGDDSRIDRLFRQSGLMRSKWDRADYKDATIRKGIDYAKGGHTGESVKARPSDCHNPTDTGNADRLIERHGRDILYVPGIGYHVWNGKYWRPDEALQINELAKQTAKTIIHEVNCDKCKRSDDERRKLAKWAIDSEQQNRIEQMVKNARSDKRVVRLATALDAKPFLLNCQNGTLDLTTGNLREHSRDDLLTRISPIAFDQSEQCPVFDAFMDRIFAGDKDMIAYVMRILGYCITGDISVEKFWIFFGNGANGKSKLLGVVEHILGEMAGIAPETLLVQSKWGEHSTQIADLMGRRLVIASETEKGARLKTGLIKQLTGDRSITARRMNRDFMTFNRTHKIVMMTNEKPVIREDSEGMWRRLELVPFKVQIPVDERDEHLADKLMAEASGILNRLLAGCLDWQRNGLQTPTAVIGESQAYRTESDPLQAYLDECCFEAPNACISAASLYENYSEWCKRSGESYMNKNNFGKTIAKRGYNSVRRRFGNAWMGITLNSQNEQREDVNEDEWTQS